MQQRIESSNASQKKTSKGKINSQKKCAPNNWMFQYPLPHQTVTYKITTAREQNKFPIHTDTVL